MQELTYTRVQQQGGLLPLFPHLAAHCRSMGYSATDRPTERVTVGLSDTFCISVAWFESEMPLPQAHA